jgi:hypothetical protein
MKRSKPLSRKTPMRRKAPRRRSRVGADPGYVKWLHNRPCVLAGRPPTGPGYHECAGRIEQSHARNLNGPTGVARKESDANSVPMCTGAHREWEARNGYFKHWSREARRQWMIGWIVQEHAAYQLSGGVLA